jgi:UDP-N-acetylglucosamine 1-carboxyvinyltransferase
MSYLIINGGRKLQGEITNQTAKNSAIALMCATIMIKGKTILNDIPRIEEVNRIIEILTSIGVKVENLGKNKYSFDATKVNVKNINREAVEMTRASLFLFGALAARVKSFRLPNSGGCHLGERTILSHIYALQKLGINIKVTEKYYEVQNPTKLQAGKIVMYESGDTATENAIMAAVIAPGQTVIKMASANYMVQDLCYFLVASGAKIEGIGTTTLTITGVTKLSPVKEYSIIPDPIVAMTYISIAIVTKSHLTIKDCPLEFLELELSKLEVMGQKFKIKNERLSKSKNFTLVDIEIIPSELIALPNKIEGRPFPGLNIDNLPLFVPILTQARGRTMVHDWAYENRAFYLLDLNKLGCKITLLDPHRVWVDGPTELKAHEIICPPALRPAVNILIAMLGAKGQSILRNTYPIDRGYENLYEVLNRVGADIRINVK